MKKRIYFIVISIVATGSIIFNIVQYLTESQRIAYINRKQEEISLLRNEFWNYKDSMNLITAELENTIVKQSKSQRLTNLKTVDPSNHLEYKALSNLDLREFQTEGSAVITTIRAGQHFTVLNSFFPREWEVEYNGFRGWISTKEDVHNPQELSIKTITTIERVN